MNRMVSCAISMAIALASARADGTEIKVTSAGAVRGLIAEMIADYGRATGDFTNGGRAAVEKVARGEADLAVTLISEIVAVKGVRLAAAVPQPLQLYSIYVAGIPASSSNPLAARAIIAALTAPSMAERWKAAGFEPPR
jgi:ABC-type Fe3+ transport system substrate-binding protein